MGTLPEVMPLAKRDHVGHDAVALGAAKAWPSRPKPVMTSSKISRMPCLSQMARSRGEVALRRGQHAGRARHRLDDHRRDGRGVVQRHDALELVRRDARPTPARPC